MLRIDTIDDIVDDIQRTLYEYKKLLDNEIMKVGDYKKIKKPIDRIKNQLLSIKSIIHLIKKEK